MPLIEEIQDDEAHEKSSLQTGAEELKQTLRALSARLALPEDLLPSYMEENVDSTAELNLYHDTALASLRELSAHLRHPAWTTLDEEERVSVLYDVLRLYGTDPWTSASIRSVIDDMLEPLDRPALAVSLLQSLRPLFSTTLHPMLNEESGRALSRPAGGENGQDDFHDSETQFFKRPAAWGSYNILSWAASQPPSSTLEKHIGLILPPTLVLMDDWEPTWRARGVKVLSTWMDNLSSETMRRMGVDRLLRDSLIHTMSLHSNPPLTGILPVVVRLIKRTLTGRERAEAYAEVVEKGIINGWTYAPSGKEGRRVLIAIAGDLELLCGELGDGITRWLKTIIPSLLDPLQYIPTPAVLPHFAANISALRCVIDTVAPTGRIQRWRGQIIDVLARLWIQLDERGEERSETDHDRIHTIRRVIREVFHRLAELQPSVRTHEYASLIQLDHQAFAALIPPA